MNEHPPEEYIRQITGLKILKNEYLNDDEIMVSPGVYEKMKSELNGKPVGYSPKEDEDFQKMLDELGEEDFTPTFDLTPSFRCIPNPIYLDTPKPNKEEIFKKVIEPILKGRRYL